MAARNGEEMAAFDGVTVQMNDVTPPVEADDVDVPLTPTKFIEAGSENSAAVPDFAKRRSCPSFWTIVICNNYSIFVSTAS